MKKQELKQDPIRDYIVNTYNYFADNRNILYSAVGGIAGVLFLFIVISWVIKAQSMLFWELLLFSFSGLCLFYINILILVFFIWI